MSIQLGPVMIPCRCCKARPGYDCTRTAREVGANRLQVGYRREPHLVRVNDARRVSELIAW